MIMGALMLGNLRLESGHKQSLQTYNGVWGGNDTLRGLVVGIQVLIGLHH